MNSNLIDSLFILHAGLLHRLRSHPPRLALLHTPLMSLTNASTPSPSSARSSWSVSARASSPPCSASSPSSRYQQCRRRILHHRPHAQNVQDQPPGEKIMNQLAGTSTSSNLSTHRQRLFILSLKWMSSPPLPVTGSWLAKSAMASPSPATCFTTHRRLDVDRRWPRVGSGIGIPPACPH